MSRPVVERLVLAGGFDSLYGFGVRDREGGRPTHRRRQVTRRDLLLQIGELDRWSRSGARANSSGQLSLDLMGLGSETAEEPTPVGHGVGRGRVDRTGPAGPSWAESSGLPEFTDAELVRAELEVLGLDASRHVDRLLPAVPRRPRRGPGGGAARLPQRGGGAGRRGQGGDPDAADPVRAAGWCS